MLGWSMNLFRVRGIQLAVHFTFVLLLALVAVEGWVDEGLGGMFWNTATFVVFFTCVVLHELGHSFTAMHYGVGVRRILLMPIGGMAEFDGIPRQPKRELWITLAGPAVNFVIAALLFTVLPKTDEVAKYSLDVLLYQVFYANLLMGCFNLLPAFPMDGGRIFRALLATRLNYLRATTIAVTIGKIVAVLGAAVALAAPELGLADERIYMVAILFVFIIAAGELEYRVVKRREIEDAHWRATMARLAPLTPPAEEPPVLTR
jgi:Zn-dependent protease